MSISLRSRKADMYTEIERLRYIADQLSQQLRDAEARLVALSAKRQATQPAAAAPQIPRAARLRIMRQLAITLRSHVTWVDGVGFKYLHKGAWDIVPKHSLKFAMEGLTQ